ncbi:MAG: aminotransferase class I/II-fold pyridoxal phosphate-dependent enzyme [Desulfobacteraceae bacterium]
MSILSRRAVTAADCFANVRDFFLSGRYGERRGDPDICDFTFGNPHEFPLSGLVEAIQRRAVPRDKNWFAYKTSEDEPCEFLAGRLRTELDLDFKPDDIAMTAGAFGAIALAFGLLLDAGDEVIIPLPGWFCYEPMLHLCGAVPVEVPLDSTSFDLDLTAIDKAIGPRTRMVVVNSPHNPTGRVYDRAQLQALADRLETASKRIGRRIFLLSDEPYRRIRFDKTPFVSPAAVYPWTLIDYSYGKVLLAPGQRLGYLALSPLMPGKERDVLRDALFSTQMALGWTFPNAVMQHAVPDLEGLSIDLAALSRRRDRFCTALGDAGYTIVRPQGTFYLFARAPGGNGNIFFDFLAERDVFVMPGGILKMPQHFRLCLTANDDMVERSLPAFREAVAALDKRAD